MTKQKSIDLEGQESEQVQTPDVKQTESTLIVPKPADVPSNIFGNRQYFDHAQRVARMFTKSDLVPKQFQGEQGLGNCVIALEIANRIGASPLMVMQNLYIVHGKPAWSSAFLIATVNACGRFSPLRYEDGKENGGRVRAWAIDKGTGERCNGAWVSMEMAKAEGWADKNGSKWKTMPELMLRYRAATFFARQFAPDISMGIHTQEEVQDVTFVEVSKEEEHNELSELLEMKKEALPQDVYVDAKRILGAKEHRSYAKLRKALQSY